MKTKVEVKDPRPERRKEDKTGRGCSSVHHVKSYLSSRQVQLSGTPWAFLGQAFPYILCFSSSPKCLCCCSVAQSCLTLCDPIDCSTPGFPDFTISRNLLKLISIESMMPSNHLILCHPLLLLPSIFPIIRVFF